MTTDPNAPNATDVDVAIIGAGFAGLGMATRLARRSSESFVVLERSHAVGGTWRDNTYPGIACDIPALLYSFSFRPPPADATSVFPTGAEIQRYLEAMVAEEGLEPYLRLGCDLTGARWDAASDRWHLSTHGGVAGEGSRTWTARVLVLAVGRLSEPRIPDLAGLDGFPGPVMHTAAWDDDVDLDGARIGVVGTGASSVQVVPHLVPAADELVVFSRTPPYLVPRDDRVLSAAERADLADPSVAATRRQEMLRTADAAYGQRLGRHPDIDEIRDRALTHLHSQVDDPALRAALTPDYEIGCKRILLSDDFYPALQHSQVVFEPSALVSVVESKAQAASGASYDLDVLVMATGFESTRPPVAGRVTGRGGETLARHWRNGMVSYASTVVSGFPNMFVLDGPNAALGHNSAIYMIETQLGYVLGALDRMAADRIRSMEVTAVAESAYTREIDDRSADTVWLSGCDSWYVDRASGRLTLLWPGTAASFRDRNGAFDPEPFVIERD